MRPGVAMAGLDPAVPLPRQLRWLGLDLDHTLIRYHLRAAFALIYRSLCRSLCEGGHCALGELLGGGGDAVADFEAHSDIVAKGLVFDFETGDLLKLDGQGYVCLAQHGVRAPPLSPAEIRQRYGRRPWRHFAALQTEPRGSADTFRSCLENFDAPAALLYARLVDLHDRRGQRYTFGPAVMAAFEENYSPAQFASGGGGYFPALRDDTATYVAERLELVRWLRDVRRQGCQLFLMTNSAPDYAQTLLDGAFGGRGGWQGLFDLAVFTARKSGTSRGFFSTADPPPFARLAGEEPGPALEQAELAQDAERIAGWGGESAAGVRYVGGNLADLRLVLGDDGAVAYVGDNHHSDIAVPREVAGWKTIALVDELRIVDHAQHAKDHDREVLRSSLWGSWFHCPPSPCRTEEGGREGLVPSFAASVLLEHADGVVGDLSELAEGKFLDREAFAQLVTGAGAARL